MAIRYDIKPYRPLLYLTIIGIASGCQCFPKTIEQFLCEAKLVIAGRVISEGCFGDPEKYKIYPISKSALANNSRVSDKIYESEFRACDDFHVYDLNVSAVYRRYVDGEELAEVDINAENMTSVVVKARKSSAACGVDLSPLFGAFDIVLAVATNTTNPLTINRCTSTRRYGPSTRNETAQFVTQVGQPCPVNQPPRGLIYGVDIL